MIQLILLFAPYILIPFILSLVSKYVKSTLHFFTYILTLIIIISYPFLLYSMEDYLQLPRSGPGEDSIQLNFLICNMFIFLPIALILQYVFNRVINKLSVK